eukprot:7387632-Prymnesium_polylepis.2
MEPTLYTKVWTLCVYGHAAQRGRVSGSGGAGGRLRQGVSGCATFVLAAAAGGCVLNWVYITTERAEAGWLCVICPQPRTRTHRRTPFFIAYAATDE